MKEIYIILYSTHSVADCFESYPDDNYFDDKNKAIKYLESKRYKHLCDDEYRGAYDKHAEIIKLINLEDK